MIKNKKEKKKKKKEKRMIVILTLKGIILNNINCHIY